LFWITNIWITIVGEQKDIFQKVTEAVIKNVGGMFFLYDYGGTGKTFSKIKLNNNTNKNNYKIKWNEINNNNKNKNTNKNNQNNNNDNK